MAAAREELHSLIADYLADLDAIQSRTRDALHQRQIDLARLGSWDQEEKHSQDALAIEELRAMVDRRAEILAMAQSLGLSVTTLQELAANLDDEGEELVKPVRILQKKMEAMHYASLSHWISCQKAWLHYTELMQLFANGGRKPLFPGRSRTAAQGGVILDTKA